MPGKGSIYLEQDLKFKKPVYINDIITTEVEIIKINIEKNIVTLNTKCINQDNIIVIDGYALVKV